MCEGTGLMEEIKMARWLFGMKNSAGHGCGFCSSIYGETLDEAIANFVKKQNETYDKLGIKTPAIATVEVRKMSGNITGGAFDPDAEYSDVIKTFDYYHVVKGKSLEELLNEN